MARRNKFLQLIFFNPLEIITSQEAKNVTLEGPQVAMLAHVLRYAISHGPAVYGTKENRFPVPVLDELIKQTHDVVTSDVLELGSWDAIKNSENSDVSLTLTGPQVQLLRSVLSYADERGNAFFGVPRTDEEQDAYRSLIADALSKL
jgi:hypothetical protein